MRRYGSKRQQGRRAPYLLLVLVVLSGCGPRELTTSLRPNYVDNIVYDNALSHIRHSIQFTKGRYTDSRNDTSKIITFRWRSVYNIYAERPIDEAIFEGLKTLFSRSGHVWNESEDSKVRIDVVLLYIQAGIISDRPYAGIEGLTASSTMQVNFTFVKTNTEEVIYNKTYHGYDRRRQILFGTSNMVKTSIDSSFVHLINQVGMDTQLAESLKALNIP